ncbi:putative exopolyphosphatase [Aspergillus foveolatus]|uniref:putative exopolyphosphatase n=1 Tax=Aspergillus foveolatus TaxID=210207 RepID=UPI003CCE1439
MRVPSPEHSLLQFLRTALQVHHRFVSGSLSRAESPIYVIGNPSADLDSIVSALVYSYFANNRVPRDYPRPHVPVINLDSVSAGPELGRLRPEFVKALQLSRSDAGNTVESSLLKEHFLTVADFANQVKERRLETQLQADSVLVDWNALPVRSSDTRSGKGSLPSLPVEFTVLGCIDHHADEGFLPPIANTQPSLIATAGSCTSLVVTELEKMGLWHKSDEVPPNEEVLAKLAMSPILIDTANLKSKDKVTNLDISARDFLFPKATATDALWDADRFYTEIQETKQNSLDLLTVDEILGRDYKDWDEKPTRHADQIPLRIGICSVVKSIPWIVRKAGNPHAFIDCLKSFASERKLDVVSVMTAFSSKKEVRFSRELLVWGLNSEGVNAVKALISEASSELGLEEWESLDEGDDAQGIKDALSALENDSQFARLWIQTNVAKSRKQVAPVIRAAAASL